MKTTEKLWGLWKRGARTFVRISIIHFVWNLQQNETSSYKGLEDITVSCVELAEGDLGRNGCVDNYRGSTLVRARWAELPGDPYQQFGRQTPKASRDTGNHTQFSKAKGRVQRSTAHGQAVWVLCGVNVHIHNVQTSWSSTQLGQWFFKKSLIVKVFSICLSIRKLRPSFFIQS